MAQLPKLGIMLLDTQFPRIPGDVGNPDSYPFPVRLMKIEGATVQRSVFESDPGLLELFVHGAHELESEGVCAITSSCGYLSPFQEDVAKGVNIPVFLSSLMQVPLVHAMTQKRVAIITASKPNLNTHVLFHAGISEDIPLVIEGMQDSPAFRDPILNNNPTLNTSAVEEDIVQIASDLLQKYNDIGAFVFECHNLAPYGNAVVSVTGKPVFDIISFAQWVYNSVVKRRFPVMEID